MRLVTFALKSAAPNRFHVGVYCPKKKVVIDLESVLRTYGFQFYSPLTMKQFLELGEEAIQKAKQAADLGLFATHEELVIFKAPISDPPKVFCVGMNYVDHCLEQNQPVPKEPVIFSKFSNSVISPGDDIVVESSHSNELDYEVELAIVIGKAGKRIDKANALKHVAGFTVAHDVSARDWQLKRNGGQWLMGKTGDSFCPLGPAIVTLDEVVDPHNLGIRCYLNDKEVQNSSTKQLVHKTEAIIEWISQFTTLQAGDVILTGTPPGVGCFRKPPRFLKDGDVVRCEIDRIGAIVNRVVIKNNNQHPTPSSKL